MLCDLKKSFEFGDSQHYPYLVILGMPSLLRIESSSEAFNTSTIHSSRFKEDYSIIIFCSAQVKKLCNLYWSRRLAGARVVLLLLQFWQYDWHIVSSWEENKNAIVGETQKGFF